MSEITNKQKAEVKAFIDNLSTVYTDTISLIYKNMGLDTTKDVKTPKNGPKALDEVKE